MGARIREWAERWKKPAENVYGVALLLGGYFLMIQDGGPDIDTAWWNPLTWLIHLLFAALGAMMLTMMIKIVWFFVAIPIAILRAIFSKPQPAPAPVVKPTPVLTPIWPTPPPHPVVVPDEYWSPEPIVAWRRWQLYGTTLRGARHLWPSPTFEATCHTCGTVPGWNCTCGIYATKTDQRWWRGRPLIYGRVELTGNVVEHEQGYRAERARIIELFVPADLHPEEIASRYPDVTIHVVAPFRKEVG